MSIKLAEALAALRHELNQAKLDGADEEIRFRLGPITLELKVGVETSTSASGKVGLDWILASFKGEVKAGSETTQTIKLTLEPIIGETPGPVVIKDKVPKDVK